jgi:hypothetical protein
LIRIARNAALIPSALLVACTATPRQTPPPVPLHHLEAPAAAYVVRRGWHIDIGFAIRDLEAPLAAAAAVFPGDQYLLFGFGDRYYLRNLDHRGRGVFGALWPGPGLVLATAVRASPEAVFGTENVRRIMLSPAQMDALQTYVWRTLVSHDGELPAPQPGPNPDSVFFDSVQHYSLLHTCNTWAAEALRSAGLPVSSSGVEFAGQLWEQVRRLPADSGVSPSLETGTSGTR